MSPVRRTLTAIGLPIGLILLWHLLSVNSTNFFVPKPVQLVQTLGNVWIGPRFIEDVVPSVLRLIVGVVLAITLGIAAGLLIGSNRVLRAMTEPVLEFLRAIPPPVMVPILMLLLGVNDAMKVLVIVSGCIWPVLLNTVEGVRAVDDVLTDTCRVYRIHGASRIFTLVVPSAGPQIFAGVRQALSLGLILMVISEMFASSAGLGFTIVQFQRSFSVPEMWSGIAVLGLLGIALSVLYQFVSRRVLSWYYGQREVDHAG
ncbi:MAG: ABC transporter permease [Dermatophilaceae bacterium]